MTLLAPARTVAILGAGASLMWSSVVEDLVDRLVPDGGKGLLGKEKLCSECQGRGYTRKNQGVWRACYAGRCWISVGTIAPMDGGPLPLSE
jgi:hypothetical protein